MPHRFLGEEYGKQIEPMLDNLRQRKAEVVKAPFSSAEKWIRNHLKEVTDMSYLSKSKDVEWIDLHKKITALARDISERAEAVTLETPESIKRDLKKYTEK